MQPFRDLQQILSKISTNFNQIAKKVNTNSVVYKEETKNIQKEVRILSMELNKQTISYKQIIMATGHLSYGLDS